jgi:hypothetical protein
VQDAGVAYTDAGKAMLTAASNLVGHAKYLASIWSGDAADKHLEQLRKLHDTLLGLAENAYTVGDAYSWLGSEKMMGWYRKAPVDYGGIFQDDGTARDFVSRYLQRVADAHNYHPPEIAKDLPVPNQKSGYGKPATTGGPPAVGGLGPGGAKLPHDPGGKIPNGKLPGGHLPGGNIPGGNHPGGNLPGGSHPGGNLPGGNLPGGNLPGGNHPSTKLQYFHMPPGGGSGGLGGLHGGGAGGLPGGGTGGLPGSGLAGGGAGGGLSGGAMNDALAAERAAMGGAGANGMGMGMPMGGGGGAGGQSEDRERSTWLSEDEDIWGGDGDVAPPVIG